MILAAGLSRRFGSLKQLEGIGPHGELLVDYAVYDALRVGFRSVILVVRAELEEDFRRHLGEVGAGALPVGFAHQDPTDLPAPPGAARLGPGDGRDAPAGSKVQPPGGEGPPGVQGRTVRVRPWGTGHAVLSARHRVTGPFAVCNGDDFYGRRSLELLAHWLGGGREVGSASPGHAPGGRPTEVALVGYPLAATLSAEGGVSRAVCDRTPSDGWRITELLDVRRVGTAIVGRTTGGDRRELRSQELVSMNLWGFRDGVLPALARLFEAFLEEAAGPGEPEFLLVEAIDRLLEAGEARLTLIPAPDKWFGVTYARDRGTASERILELVRGGEYPERLRDGFAKLPRTNQDQ